MLGMRSVNHSVHRVAGPCERLPFRNAQFDGAFAINVLEHRSFLSLPVGPLPPVSLIDTLSLCHLYGAGFFQYLVAEKAATAS